MSNVDISKADLFNNTSYRDLVNGDLSNSYVKLDVNALMNVAALALESPYLSLEIVLEGEINMCYLLKLANNTEVIARILYVSVSCPHLLTASEVATMTYLHKKFHLPIPRVYTWISKFNESNVGTEYIIMKKLPGILMDPTYSEKFLEMDVYDTVAKMQQDLSSVYVSQMGSLFSRKT